MKVSLRTDSWHVKLQEWTFGSIMLRKNFCPHFWLTVFCILAAPFLVLFRELLGRSIVFIDKRLADAIESLGSMFRVQHQLGLEQEARTIGSLEAYRMWFLLEDWNSYSPRSREHPLSSKKLRQRYGDILDVWFGFNPDWIAQFEKHEADFAPCWKSLKEELDSQRATLVEARCMREALMGEIARVTQTIIRVIAFSLAASLIAIVGFGLYQLIINFFVIPWFQIMIICLLTIGIFLVAAFFVVGIRYVIKRLNNVGPVSEPGLLSLYLNAAKENYCPHIEWDSAPPSDHPDDSAK